MTRSSPEYHASYDAKYLSDPAKRARRAEIARLRRADPAQRQKFEAREAVKKAVRRGEIVKLPCERCGAILSEAHHPDYDKPLEVVWLCKPHHREEHPRPRKPLKGPRPLVTECRYGHPYDEGNTYHDPRGKRGCRACNAASQARRKANAVKP